MQAMEIQEHARKLHEVQGDRALARAAQKAQELEHQANTIEAQTWPRIEAALHQMRGPRVS